MIKKFVLIAVSAIILLMHFTIKSSAAAQIPKDVYEYEGNYYKVYDNICDSWDEAKIYCEKLNGHMVTITDAAEEKFVLNMLKDTANASQYFIGATDANNEGSWEWITGEKFAYTNWITRNGEPTNRCDLCKKSENYACIDYKYAKGYNFVYGCWNDITNSACVKQSVGFICEWEKSKININVYVSAIDKNTNEEVPVPKAEVYFYVDGELRGTYTTDDNGYKKIPLDHLTEKELQKATISAKKIVSRGKAINGTARDALFEHFPKDENGDYYRYTMELHSETIDDAGNWVGVAIPEVDKFSLARELELKLSEPRMLVNLAVCYFADDETSQSGEYVMSVMEMLNQYSHRLAEATDAHIMIDKILLFSTDSRFDFYSMEGEIPNPASMADIRIETKVKDDGNWWNNILIHHNAHVEGFFVDGQADVDEEYMNHFYYLKDKADYLTQQYKTFGRIILSGTVPQKTGNTIGEDFSMFDDAVSYSETMTHETGHYIMGFYDEYLRGDKEEWTNVDGKPYDGNFGLMDHEHESIEISRNSVEYAYMNDAYVENDDETRHTHHSWMRKGACEDYLAYWMTNQEAFDASVDFSRGKYKSNYSKVKGTDDHTATYWYAELDDSDFLSVPLHNSRAVSLALNEAFETTDWEESNEFLASSSAVLTKEPVADVSFTSTSSVMKVTVKGNSSTAYAVSYRKAGEDSYRTAKLTNGTASLIVAKGELAEVRISDGKNYNCYYIDRTPNTDTGYIYTSADNAVMAYVANDTDDTYTFIADNTDYTNGSYRAVNQATWISSGKAFDSGEIYSVASYMAEIDYTTLTWFKYADGKWTALETDYSTEENRNIGARADLAGAGMYVLMAEPAGAAKALPAKYLKYQQSADRDAVVTLTFNDPNVDSKYYNVYYSDEPLTDKDADNVVVRSFDADSPKVTLNLLERGRTVYAAVEIVLENGSRSPLSEITLTGGEADSDGDGIPDWYCSLHQLWGENGENKDIAGSDDDGDGFSNLEEYQKGTDPKCKDDIIKDTDVIRLYGDTRYETSYAIAAALKRQMGVERFSTVIIANGKNFPDALAGSYLAGVKKAPILMANEKYQDSLQSYVKANLKAGGTIYVLGGNGAVPESVLNGLSGYNIKRLAGANRYETNLLILEEAGVSGKEILVCTGNAFADSLSASATGKPILLVRNKELTDGQIAFLKKYTGSQFYIIGGEGAVSKTIENAIKKYGTTKRIYGDSRYETSIEVAKTFFKNPDSAVLAYAKNFPDGLSGGPLAMEMNAPLILTSTEKTGSAGWYVDKYNIDKGFVLGDSSLISDAAVQKIF